MKRALLIIDVQNEYFCGRMPVTYPEGSFGNILKAMDTAFKRNIPVILIQHTASNTDSVTFKKGSATWEIHSDVLSKPYNYLVEKNYPDSFTETNLEEILKKEAVDTVTIAGYMTQMCCDTTARQAFHLGYKVEFLADATGTLAFSNSAGKVEAEELHRAVLVTQAAVFSRVLAVEEWIKQLDYTIID